MEKPKIRWSDLDGLVEFCPCSLRERKVERTLLLDVFLARSEAYQSPESANRRASLALALDLVSRCSRLDGYNLESIFRASTYSRALPDGTTWDVHPSLRRVQRGWAVYEQNELLSLALQALFGSAFPKSQ